MSVSSESTEKAIDPVEDKSTTQTNTTSSNAPTKTETTPSNPVERKILIFREMPDNASEESVRGIFKSEASIAGTITNIRADVDHTWFVTFSTGDAALQAYKFAMGTTHEGKSLQVRFKTVGAASYYNTSAGPSTHTSQIPYNAFPGANTEYQSYWEQQAAYQDYTRVGGNQPRPSGAVGGSRSHPTGAAGGVGGAPHVNGRAGGKPKGGRQPNVAGGPRSIQGGSTANHQQNADNAKSQEGTGSNHTQGRARTTSGSSRTTERFNTTNNTNTTGAPHGNTNRRGGAAVGERRGGRTERKETGSQVPVGATAATGAPNAGKSTSQASLNLTNFPPLGPPSGPAVVAANNGYNGKSFLQYSREAVIASITQRESSTVVRPCFDNSDTPILLTSAHLDLEINKPLPVGAKFEPLAQDKRTRSLSKNAAREAISSSAPTAAQIVAAAAAKASSQPAAPKKTTPTTKAPVAAAAPVVPAEKKEKVAKAAPASAKPASTTTITPPVSTGAKSWADRARTSPGEPTKTEKPAKIEKTPTPAVVPEKIAEPVEVAPVVTETEVVPTPVVETNETPAEPTAQ